MPQTESGASDRLADSTDMLMSIAGLVPCGREQPGVARNRTPKVKLLLKLELLLISRTLPKRVKDQPGSKNILPCGRSGHR